MNPLKFTSIAAVLAATALVTATPAAAHGSSSVGVEYDQGGTSTPIDGPLPAVDGLADQITHTTDSMLRDLAHGRDALPYGAIDPPRHSPTQLTTYPAPAGQTASDQYAVTVRQGHTDVSPFTFKVDARKPDTNLETDTSWTSFSFAGAVTVSVTKLAGDATGCIVRPTSAHIRTTFAGGTCSYTLTKAANVSVEFTPNTTNPVLHPMLVFANPPEVDVPPANDPDVLYFGPGVHDIGRGIQLHSNETVYVAGGAWVKGSFTGSGLHNVVFRGRGIIDGLFLDTGDQDANKNQPGLIDLADSHNVVVDGVTFVDGPRFNVRVLGSDVTVHNIKVISWWYSTDCIWAGSRSLVEGNFCKVNDDSLKPMTGPSVIRDNVVWQLENGAPFMISWNIKDDQSDFHVYDNDVIHAEHYWLSPQAIFRSRHATPGHMSRYLFENIRVEDASWRLFYLILENNKWYDPTLGYGQISALIFRNITATTPFTMPSVVSGIDPQHRVYDATFQDVYMDGTCVADAAAGNFQIDPATTDQIRIVKSAHRACSTAPGGHGD
jgi:hypothetical protein